MKNHRKRTKIVATIGPASASPEMLEALMLKGVNVFRINFSHAKHEEVKKTVAQVRAFNEKHQMNVALLADLQGPKLRVGIMEDDVILKKDDIFVFTTEKCIGNKKQAFMTYKNFPLDVNPGEKILVDDGKLIFEVLETDKTKNVVTKVLFGGALHSNKGVNLPNTKVSLPALTEKDKVDALFAIEMEFDWIALSFVRKADDVLDLKSLINTHSSFPIPIIAKIEKPEAVEAINHIIPHCDGLMVARGDLGVEIPMEEVPLIQKKLVMRAKQAHIPVIIATQMMETMINSQVPTRAEVNDVANSIMDRADALMLSGETSVGQYPLKVIEQMQNIIKSVEDSPLIQIPQTFTNCTDERYITNAICHQAGNLSSQIDARIITTLTNTGYTAFQISSWRPKSNILVYSSNKRVVSMLNLLWGVRAIYYDRFAGTDKTIRDINNIAYERGYIDEGDFAINLTSMPVRERGMVNTLRITQYQKNKPSKSKKKNCK